MTYCISDIHGHYEEFMALIDEISLGADNTLYVLGDVIDRGCEPIKCLQFIMSRPNIKMLIGNHEHMLLNVLIHGEDPKRWVEDNGGKITLEQLNALSKEDRNAILDFLKALPYYYSIQVQNRNFLLVHAGLNLSLRKKREPLATTLQRQDLHEMLWIREDFHSKKALSTHVTVFGHTPAMLLHYQRNKKIWFRNTIWHDKTFKDKIGIDCCCHSSGGKLAALRLDDMREFYVSCNAGDYGQ
jgi:serine/threonine protein phosphatase 1